MQRLQHTFRRFQEQASRYKKDIFQKPRRGTTADKVYSEERNMNLVARSRVESMRKNIALNTPRIVAGLLLASTLPQLYYYYQNMWLEYTDPEFSKNLKKSVDYLNMKSAFTCATIFGLQVVKYCDAKATQRALPKRGNVFLWLLLPFGLSMSTISFWPYLDKRMIFGSYFTDATVLLIETKLVNEAVMPFWFFNLKYTLHVFDLVYLTCIYFSMKRMRNHLDTMPHKYFEAAAEHDQEDVLNIQRALETQRIATVAAATAQAATATEQADQKTKTLMTIAALQKQIDRESD